MTKIAQESIENHYDVVVLGGGLAGLCLARQLALSGADLKVLVLEKRGHPVPEAAHKVGESSVEAGAFYFAEVLDLAEHIHDHQLPKLGLRFFFNQPGHQHLADGLEMGLSARLRTPSYQLDRGRLENHLAQDMTRLGVTFLAGCRVLDVVLEDSDQHRVAFQIGGVGHQVEATWVVDACGRAPILKKKLGLKEAVDHDVNAVWFRVEDLVRIDDWGTWPEVDGEPEVVSSRWLSTNHLMGEGYWVWLIPLASGCTSVGIVADAKIHPLDSYNSLPKAMAWLQQHEPSCAQQLAPFADQAMDFLAVKHFTHGCRQVFSEQRWAITGEAGLFLDPFYSPGSDFIAISNTLITDLILTEQSGRPIGARTVVYNQVYQDFFRNTLLTYQDQYPLFGNPRVMPVKIIWDYAVYWSFPALLVLQRQTSNLKIYPRVRSAMTAMTALNQSMQAFFRAWHDLQDEPIEGVFLDQAKIALLRSLNADLSETMDSDTFLQAVQDNMAKLHCLSGEIVRTVGAHFPELMQFMPEGVGEPGPDRTLDEVFAALGMLDLTSV